MLAIFTHRSWELRLAQGWVRLLLALLLLLAGTAPAAAQTGAEAVQTGPDDIAYRCERAGAIYLHI